MSNWSRYHLGCVQQPSLKTQDTNKFCFMLFAFSHAFCCLFCRFLPLLWLECQLLLYTPWGESHLVSSFFPSFTSVLFLSVASFVFWVKFCCKAVSPCPTPNVPASKLQPAHWLRTILYPTPKTSLRMTAEPPANQQSWEIPFCNEATRKGISLTQRQRKYNWF